MILCCVVRGRKKLQYEWRNIENGVGVKMEMNNKNEFWKWKSIFMNHHFFLKKTNFILFLFHSLPKNHRWARSFHFGAPLLAISFGISSLFFFFRFFNFEGEKTWNWGAPFSLYVWGISYCMSINWPNASLYTSTNKVTLYLKCPKCLFG